MGGKEEAAAAKSSSRASTSAQQWSFAAANHPATPHFVGFFPYICVYWFLRRHTYISRNLLDYTTVLLTDRADSWGKIEKKFLSLPSPMKVSSVFSIEFSLFAFIAIRYILLLLVKSLWKFLEWVKMWRTSEVAARGYNRSCWKRLLQWSTHVDGNDGKFPHNRILNCVSCFMCFLWWRKFVQWKKTLDFIIFIICEWF